MIITCMKLVWKVKKYQWLFQQYLYAADCAWHLDMVDHMLQERDDGIDHESAALGMWYTELKGKVKVTHMMSAINHDDARSRDVVDRRE